MLSMTVYTSSLPPIFLKPVQTKTCILHIAYHLFHQNTKTYMYVSVHQVYEWITYISSSVYFWDVNDCIRTDWYNNGRGTFRLFSGQRWYYNVYINNICSVIVTRSKRLSVYLRVYIMLLYNIISNMYRENCDIVVRVCFPIIISHVDIAECIVPEKRYYT